MNKEEIIDIKNNIQYQGLNKNTKEKTPVLIWNINRYCNFNCSYCISKEYNNYSDKEIKKFQEKQKIKNKYILKRIEMISKKTEIEIQISGGEPTFSDLENIIDNLINNKKIKSIIIFSNFSKEADYYSNILKKDKRILFVLSFHTEYHNKEHFTSKFKKIKGNVTAAINIMNFKDEDYLFWINSKISFYFNYLHSIKGFEIKYSNTDFKYKKINDYQKYYFRTKDNEYLLDYATILEYGLDYFEKDRYCNVQIYHIDTEGNITRSCTGESLPINGNLLPETYCKLKNCLCSEYLEISKRFL
jgi:organic radical activating enzyme